MKVYTVWYISDLDSASHLWGIYGTEERAKEEVAEIRGDKFQYTAWYNEEEVQ